MSANKDGKKWRCQFYYTDWQGVRRKKNKRGFRCKRDAVEWEKNFKASRKKYMCVRFDEFTEKYLSDMGVRLRESTMQSKRYLYRKHIIPYFKDRNLCDIKISDIREWHNTLLRHGYSATYLKQMNSQLKALFAYAERYYGLKENPCKAAGSIGSSRGREMTFWTRDEFECFIGLYDKENEADIRLIFLMLYWTGMRIGELLALTGADIDIGSKHINISKSYQRIKGRDVITPPKTARSIRTVTIPDFLCTELSEYLQSVNIYDGMRIFTYSKLYIEKNMHRMADRAKIKRIRVHDLRHSHASLLIEMGVTPLLIAERLGHEKVETTLDTYSHLYPNKQRELAEKLEVEFKNL